MTTDPADCPYHLVSRAALLLTAALRRELREAGVDHVRPAYLGVLLSLWREDGLRVLELGRRAGLEPSSMTGLLDRMERDGLLARGSDPEDRRAHRVHLTERGREAKRAVGRVVDRTLADLLYGVREAELAQFKATLRRVMANANGSGQP